ncbi:CAZyme family CE3 [Penicillium hetheringtonii]|uniref:CAZyme family CE3 n=1 Tax=Penicillium hetheringtonii TaxID=911720 RepID=A0AAD6DKG6_9EURO|nr:CAZyme family CE3 [Penicillium hetheringtonii]
MRQPTPIYWVVQVCLLWLTILSPFSLASAISPPIEASLTTREDSSSGSQYDEKFVLRVLPLGASITLGYKSTDGNGYRDWIRQQLRWAGWQVEMIGSKRFGTMRDNYNEGHIGFRVDQLESKVEKAISEKPNLILINAGTNDALQDYHVYSTGIRMNRLIERLFDNIQGTTIILSTLLPNGKAPEKVESINEQYRSLVAYRRDRKERIVLADMSKFITVDELVDKIHPDDAGYEKMASVWWAAFQEAEKEKMLQNFNYTISQFSEKKLDDNITNPHLFKYSARLSRRSIMTMDNHRLVN